MVKLKVYFRTMNLLMLGSHDYEVACKEKREYLKLIIEAMYEDPSAYETYKGILSTEMNMMAQVGGSIELIPQIDPEFYKSLSAELSQRNLSYQIVKSEPVVVSSTGLGFFAIHENSPPTMDSIYSQVQYLLSRRGFISTSLLCDLLTMDKFELAYKGRELEPFFVKVQYEE